MPKKGKKGLDQRVKGNVKAASSGRMADLLGGELATGFIGFETASRGIGGREGEQDGGTEEVSHGAGAEFQVVMKQLGKRDTTTKIKALQEFSSLCDKEPVESVVSVLNVWTLMYNKLSTDNDNRVREASHKALQSCVKKIKNSLGPHLRSILGCWMAGMCDPYGSASSAAQAAFSTAFTPTKQTDALKFGFKAIVTFVEDVTLKQTQDTFSDPKVVAADERTQRYERVVVMALYGLSLTFQRLPDQFIADRREEWEEFVSEKRLWKLTRHDNPYIRAACYTVVGTLCRHGGDFIASHARQFCTLVLCGLGERDPGVVGALWETALLIINLIQDWSEYVNVAKAVLPGLWQLLNGGGHGSARLVYPCLPPLLHTLVQQVYPSDVGFAVSFLEKLKSGLQADRVRGSVSECEVVLQTFSQALLHLLQTVDTHHLAVAERQHFYTTLLNMVVELVEYSASQCPRIQASIVCGWVGRILDDLLKTEASHPWIEQYVHGWLQSQLTEKLSALVEKASDKAQFVRMASLLQSLGTHYSKPATGRRVTFATGAAVKTTPTQVNTPSEIQNESGTISEEEEDLVTEALSSERSEAVDDLEAVLVGGGDGGEVKEKCEEEQKMKEIELVLRTRKSFLRSTIASVCAHCITAVAGRRSVEHCTLLCAALRMYGEAETVVRIRGENWTKCIAGVMGGRAESEAVGDGAGGMVGAEDGEEGGGVGGREGREEGELGEEGKSEGRGRGEGVQQLSVTEVVVYLSGCLLGAMDDDVISGCDPLLVEGVVSSILLLLQTEGVSMETVTKLLHQIVQGHPNSLLLLLTKVGGEEGRCGVEWVRILLHSHQPLLLELVRGGGGEGGGVRGEDVFLWPFLDLCLTSSGHFEGEEGREMKRRVFEALLGVVQTAIQGGDSEHCAATQKQLQTMARATREVVEDYLVMNGSDGFTLFHCMLNWSLDNCRTESPLPAAVCSCYSHLTSLLPQPASYLESTAALLTSQSHSHLERVFELAVTAHLLHSPALTSHTSFWSFYQPLRPHPPDHKAGFLSLGALESFCSHQPYSPLFRDLSSDDIVTTLSGALMSTLYLAVALCETASLNTAFESLEFSAGLVTLNSQRTSDAGSNVSVAFLMQDSSQEEEKGYFRLWKTAVCEVMLTLCALQPSSSLAIQQSPIEKSVKSVLCSALDECLTVGSNNHHQWNRQLLEELIDRASMEGPLWCQVLQLFISGLERGMTEEDRATVLPDIISVVLRDPEPALVLATVSGLSSDGKTEVEGHLMGSIRGREEDVCLLCVHLHLLPKMQADLLSFAGRGLSCVAGKHASSEMTLFESLDESIQDPMAFSLLELMSLLAAAHAVPSDAWEFILCALVTITQLTSETTDQYKNSVNYTVFYCKAMQACRDVTLLLTSPLSPEQQADEWREFFSPDIQARLLPFFLNTATQTSLNLPSHCQVLQYFYMARTVAELCCTGLEGLSLETLIDVLFSPLHPFKITAFLLAKRVVSATQFKIEDDSTASQEKANIITIPELQSLLSAALERVNLDLTFQDDPLVDGCHDNTSSYLLLWLLLIEIMSHCGPEARVSLGEWLKERSLASHLFHGLFTVLGEASFSPRKTHIEVTLQPDLQTLCTVVYSSVARHLPSMLRQWYLSVDRFTTKYVSPALQQTELESVGRATTTHGNMEVRAYVGVSEVSVVYRVDEFSIELFVHLPNNYPLQPPTIREGRRVRVEASQWRKWMLQLNVFIANQNGTLMDGLLLWKSNLDNHFSGVEDCMICFSVIHGSLYSLPKMTCRTCKKKFHSACLYKWFNTSNKSSCPLCRNIF